MPHYCEEAGIKQFQEGIPIITPFLFWLLLWVAAFKIAMSYDTHEWHLKTASAAPTKRCISLASLIINGATAAVMNTQFTDAGMALHTLAEVHRSEYAKLRVCGHSPCWCRFIMCQP